MIRYLMLIAGFILLIVQHYSTTMSSGTQVWIFLAGIMVLGIPHGAADMMVANQTANIRKNKFSKANFLLQYLLRIAGFAAIFWLFPAVAVLLFIVMAAYHFGETDLNTFRIQTFTGKLFVMSYGLMILGVILLAHFDEAIPMFLLFENGVANKKLLLFINEHRYTILSFITLFFFISTFLFFASSEKTNFNDDHFLVQLAILLFLLFYMPLIIGFTFYFVMWHSMLSLKNILYYLNSNSKLPVAAIVKQLLLYSSLAIVGILIFGWSGIMFTSGNAMMVYVFIGLAVLTAPHMHIMYDMYKNIRAQQKGRKLT